MAHGIPARLSPAEGRKFAFTVGIAFLVIAGILTWRDHTIPSVVTGALGGGLILAGLAIPGHLTPVFRAWMGLALLISKVTTPIFMGVIYFLVISPTGLVRRLVSKTPIDTSNPANGTYWQVAEPRSNLHRQF